MELLMLIAGVLLLWKFGGSLNGLAVSARSKTEVLAEKVTGDAVIERSDNFEEFKKNMDGKTIHSHDEIMAHFRVND